MSDLDDVLSDQEEQETEAKAETPTNELDAEPDTDGDADSDDGEDGQEQTPEAEEVGEEKPKARRESKSVPLSAFLEVQNRLKAELEERNRQLAEYEEKAKQQPDYSAFLRKGPDELPSIYDDEQGFTAGMRQAQEADSANLRFEMSLYFASQTYGQEKVDAALGYFRQAAEKNPALNTALERSANPVSEIIQWHETQTHLAKVEAMGGFDAYEKALRKQAEDELKAKKPEAQLETEEEAIIPPTRPQMPGNFNKGSKAGHKVTPPNDTLDALLG